MSKPWLATYPSGVPAEIDPSQHASIAEMADTCFSEFADRPAYLQMGRQLTYGDLDRQSVKSLWRLAAASRWNGAW